MTLTRMGASSTIIVCISPMTPPLTVDTVVEPGYGRCMASPPNITIAPSGASRDPSACTTSVYPTSLSVTSRSARSMS